MLKPGDIAPLDTKLLNIEGIEISLKDYIGKYLVLYFYPKDDTPGCTTEACNFRDFNKDIESLGAKVIGISMDNQKSHTKFKNKYNLNFELLSDEHGDLIKAFGAYGEKKMFGRTFDGILRSTFIIDTEGKIIKTWEEVTPENHAEEVYNWLNANIQIQ